jgi:hypothetical protein
MIFLSFVTLVSLLVAITMSVIAWRLAAEERRRSNARVAGLAADIHEGNLDLQPSAHGPARSESATPADLFAIAQPAQSGSRLATVIACGVIVVGSLATVGLLLGSGSHTAKAALVQSRTTPAGPADPVPLELIALGHDRTGDDLTVRGVVRNPPSGVAVDRLTAVVFLFNREGGFLTSGRATVESPALVPGGESRFVVTVPAAANVGRYRVSFRTDDRVVPHVDRREPSLARR